MAFIYQISDNCRLTGTNFTSEQDKPGPLPNTIIEIGQSPFMGFTVKEKFRIRNEIKGLCRQIKI